MTLQELLQINFDYPYEVLTSISGSYYYLAGDMQKRVVKSLTFHTNKAKYGPYGKAVGTIFSSANKEGKIAGFHGRSGTFLDAIGIHMQHWVRDEVPQHPYPPERGVFRNLLHKIYRWMNKVCNTMYAWQHVIYVRTYIEVWNLLLYRGSGEAYCLFHQLFSMHFVWINSACLIYAWNLCYYMCCMMI